MSADKVQDALNAVLGNDGGGPDCECATCYHLRVSAHALIAAVREDEKARCIAAVERLYDLRYDVVDRGVTEAIKDA